MTWPRLSKLALIVLSFVAAGPLIGLVVLAIGGGLFYGATSSTGSTPGFAISLMAMPLIFLQGYFFAHWNGAIAAAIAGLLVACYAARWGEVPMLIGAVAGIASLGGTFLRVGMPDRGFGPPEIYGYWFVPIIGIGIIAMHVLPAIACTRLTRRWQ